MTTEPILSFVADNRNVLVHRIRVYENLRGCYTAHFEGLYDQTNVCFSDFQTFVLEYTNFRNEMRKERARRKRLKEQVLDFCSAMGYIKTIDD